VSKSSASSLVCTCTFVSLWHFWPNFSSSTICDNLNKLWCIQLNVLLTHPPFLRIRMHIRLPRSVFRKLLLTKVMKCSRPRFANWYFVAHKYLLCPKPVAARTKVWVWGRSLPGIADSNPAGGIDVYLLWVLSSRVLGVGLITRPEGS
jgi:hypothetical protein